MSIDKKHLIQLLLGQNIDTDASHMGQHSPLSPEEGGPLIGTSGAYDEVDEEARKQDEQDEETSS